MTRPYVIVGAGAAGDAAAVALREATDAPVVVIGDEPDPPYERPPLSKEVLRGERETATTILRPDGWYAEHGIELRTDVRVTALDPDGTVSLDSGEPLEFEACLLATGGRVRKLVVPGAELPCVRYLRTMADARALAAELSNRPRVVVVGAGFIGAEAAASARTLGCEVTMLEVLRVPLARVLGEDLGSLYADIHRDHGVDLRCEEGVERIDDAGVVGTSGTRYPADVVVVGVGIVPDDELAAKAGIACDDGIVVDASCRTSAPRVFAAGDVARWPDPYAGHPVRVEHFQNAQLQGTAAGRAMAGGTEPYASVPWFWSDQYDVNLQMLGHPDPVSEAVRRPGPHERSFTMFWLRDGRVVAALALNSPRDVAAARRLIERRVVVDAGVLADPDRDIRSLVRSA